MNKNYLAPVSKTDKRLSVLEPLVEHYISNIPQNIESVDFEQIKTDILKSGYEDEFGVLTRAEITDEILNLLAIKYGLTVV